ncbi:MAG: hypothetical protein HQL73_03735 [Magnetococcales bacterium]|nr:hypothetical protein [Magnetococcales bacterium]
MNISEGKILGMLALVAVLAVSIVRLPKAGDSKDQPLATAAGEKKITAGTTMPQENRPSAGVKTDGPTEAVGVTKGSPGPSLGMMGLQPPMGNMGNPHGMKPMATGMTSAPEAVEPVNHSQGRASGPMNVPSGNDATSPKSMGMPKPSFGFARLAPDTEAVERFLYDQKQRIRITSAQEKTWNAFAQSAMNLISTRINSMNSLRRIFTDSPMDRLDQQLTAMEAMVKQQRAFFQNFRSLHEQLTNFQKPMVESMYLSISD